MALSGSKDPNLAVLAIGQERSIVIRHIGEPSSTDLRGTERTDRFVLEVGDEPSTNRAWGNALAGLFTLGVHEIAATISEARQGSEIEVVVHYDGKERVTRFTINEEIGGRLE
jgi:hypothetical protein